MKGRPNHPTRRRGVSLIESLVIMSAASVVLSLAVVMIPRAMRVGQQAEAFHETEAAAWRFSSALRADLRLATGAAISQDGPARQVTITSAGGEPIQYRFDEESIEREQRLPDGAVSRSAFAFMSPVEWVLEELHNPPRLVVRAEAPPGRPNQSGAPLRMRLVARVGQSESSGVESP